MAIVLFRKNDTGEIESQVVNEYGFKQYFDAGWVLDAASLTENKKSSEEEIRLAAKDAGIKSWHLKSIDTLKKALSHAD